MTTLPPTHSFEKIDALAKGLPAPVVAPKVLPKVLIALCAADWKVEIHTSESVRAIGQQCRCETVVRYMMNDGVARARNNLAEIFLKTDCTHLFFLDSDIIIEPRQFQLLLDANVPIVAGMYPKKQGILDWVINYLPGEVPDQNGLLKIKHAGTGCLLIDRQTVLDDIAKNPDMLYRGDPGPKSTRYDFFPMRAVNGAYESEDWAWCNRVIRNGASIYLHTKVQCRHVGKIVYPLQFTMSDEEVVDLVFHRYGIWPDHIRSFIASGSKSPGLMGGHREQFVRLWPKNFPVEDLHQGDVLAGAYDVPINHSVKETPPVILDIGASCGAYAKWASKRWDKPTVHSYEADEKMFDCLGKTFEAVAEDLHQASTKTMKVVQPLDVESLPVADILKIDQAGSERGIIEAFQALGKISQFDAIVVRYHNELDAFFLKALLGDTHVLHCHQRFDDDEGIVKYLSRTIKPGIVMARQE